MLLAALGVSAGVLFAQSGEATFLTISLLALAGAAGVGGFLLLRERPFFAAIFLTAAFVACGALYTFARQPALPGDALARDAAALPESTMYTLEGRVESPDIWLPEQSYFVFVLRADSASRNGETLPLRGGVLVRWTEPDRPVYEGERVRVQTPVELALGQVNPGASGMEDFYRRYGVNSGVRIAGDAVERVGTEPVFSPSYQLSRFRGYLAARIAEVVPDSSLPLVLTIWLGDRRRLDADTYQYFVDSGTAHVLAVSGVHVSIVFVTLGVLFPAGVELRRARIRAVLMLLVIAAFVIVTGGRVSSVRAALMVAVFLAADWFGRERDAPTALSISAIGFLLWDPDLLFDVGFQLSFLSIASIMLFSEPIIARLERVPMPLRQALGPTLAVQLLPLPFAIQSFYVLPIIAPFANLLVIPVTTVLLWVGFIASLGAILVPPVAVIFGQSLHLLAQIVLWLAEESAAIPFAHAHVAAPTTLGVGLFVGAMFVLRGALLAQEDRARRFIAFAILGLACAAVWRPIAPRPEMTVLDVGHGDAIFVRAPGGRTMLVDAGNRSEYLDLGKRAVAPFLWANHETKLDAVLVTHPDADHIGGVKYVLEHFRVGALILGAPFPGTMEDELLTVCAQRDIPVQRVERGDRFALGGANVEVLNPPPASTRDLAENERSLVVRVTWPGFSALLTGDIESEAEAELAKMDIAAQVLKVPHHGSGTSSSPAFVAAVHPQLAVVSVGFKNKRKVVKPDVIGRYQKAGIEVLRTDIVGGVRIRPQPDGLQIEAARVQRGYITRQLE